MRAAIKRGRRGESGQAVTETLLLTMPIVMLIAAVFQVFLVDAHVFRLATRSHAEIFERAFPYNSPTYEYARSSVSWGGQDQYVPVIAFFRPYGLSEQNMRIRTIRPNRRTTEKQIEIGRGTAMSVEAGLEGIGTGALGEIRSALETLDRVERWRQDLEAYRARGGR
jgi:hypothetical protein